MLSTCHPCFANSHPENESFIFDFDFFFYFQAKRDAQENLLLDEDDPTLNNPALDLEDSDVDDEWTPVKVHATHISWLTSGILTF